MRRSIFHELQDTFIFGDFSTTDSAAIMTEKAIAVANDFEWTVTFQDDSFD